MMGENSIDFVICESCGWDADVRVVGDSIPHECPECGASKTSYYKEKTFRKEEEAMQ